MKTKTNVFLLCVVCLCFALSSKAQQPQTSEKPNISAMIMQKGIAVNYTYKVFQAPNKMYGYDIFKNGKGIFHQPATANPKDATAFSQQQIAEKAAGVSIEKLKNNKPANLSPEEIKKIITNN